MKLFCCVKKVISLTCLSFLVDLRQALIKSMTIRVRNLVYFMFEQAQEASNKLAWMTVIP